MKSSIDSLLEEYGESHKNHTNKLIHWICVPTIFFSIVALFHSIPNEILLEIFGHNILASWASLVLVVVFIYYLSLSVSLAIGMAMFSTLCVYFSIYIESTFETPLPIISLILFVVAWIGQFYGHHIEGKKPSFLKDLQFLLIGPGWLLHFIYKRIGIKM